MLNLQTEGHSAPSWEDAGELARAQRRILELERDLLVSRGELVVRSQELQVARQALERHEARLAAQQEKLRLLRQQLREAEVGRERDLRQLQRARLKLRRVEEDLQVHRASAAAWAEEARLAGEVAAFLRGQLEEQRSRLGQLEAENRRLRRSGFLSRLGHWFLGR